MPSKCDLACIPPIHLSSPHTQLEFACVQSKCRNDSLQWWLCTHTHTHTSFKKTSVEMPTSANSLRREGLTPVLSLSLCLSCLNRKTSQEKRNCFFFFCGAKVVITSCGQVPWNTLCSAVWISECLRVMPKYGTYTETSQEKLSLLKGERGGSRRRGDG